MTCVLDRQGVDGMETQSLGMCSLKFFGCMMEMDIHIATVCIIFIAICSTRWP